MRNNTFLKNQTQGIFIVEFFFLKNLIWNQKLAKSRLLVNKLNNICLLVFQTTWIFSRLIWFDPRFWICALCLEFILKCLHLVHLQPNEKMCLFKCLFYFVVESTFLKESIQLISIEFFKHLDHTFPKSRSAEHFCEFSNYLKFK